MSRGVAGDKRYCLRLGAMLIRALVYKISKDLRLRAHNQQNFSGGEALCDTSALRIGQRSFSLQDHQRAVRSNTTLADALNKEHSKQVKENREYIKTIGEVLFLTARQNIAQRGHDESEESKNKGNFKEILDVVASHDAVVKHRLTTIHNAKYTSKIIQNEVLDCLAEMVRSEIIDEVKDGEFFSIMADETKDVSKKEQISFVLRYYYNGVIKESFLHFECAERLDAAGLTEKIVHLLERHGLDYKNHLIGQAYDGAAVMSAKHSGVQARIREQAKYAFYIHCMLVDAVKAVPEADEFFALLQSLYVFTSGSYVHSKWLAVQTEMYGSTRELQQLSDTRWACRFLALHNIMDRLPALKQVLQEMAQERRGEKSSEARGLLAQIDLEFVVHLVTLRKLFGETKLLSEMLQSTTVDLSRAVDLVEALVQTLNDFRQESFFDNLWDEVLNICEQCDAATQSVAKRPRKLSSRLREYHILSTVGQRELECDKETFRTSFFYPAIDCMLSELSKRFSKTNCELMCSIRSLNPKSDAFLRDTTLFDFGRLFGANIEDLGHELHQFKRLLERKVQGGVIEKPSDTVALTRFTEPYK
ncbi:Zinc finger MYM-type protein 1 [Merluccius polli]|uniref:Zinc finger MYM-type protein 1 n=1 Tax=Merluccius polli TaxID=89951 RepID=A0AA47MN40_MERPO|nr:Zinc finger MYM-type protein 1 [Merluccius polli]